MISRFAAFALLVAGLAVAEYAPAAIVTLTGANFDIQYDDAQSAVALFGTPTLASGNILFSGNNFIAQSANGQGPITSGDAFSLFLIAHQNVQLTGLSLFALGDYRLQGANSYVKVGGSLAADDATSSDPSRSVVRSLNLTTPATTNGEIHSPLTNQNTNWQASAGVTSSMSPWLSSSSTVGITISSILTAFTSAGDPNPTFAFIQQKLFVQQPAVTLNVSSDPMATPLPATLPALLGGLAAMGWVRRKRPGQNGARS